MSWWKKKTSLPPVTPDQLAEIGKSVAAQQRQMEGIVKKEETVMAKTKTAKTSKNMWADAMVELAKERKESYFRDDFQEIETLEKEIIDSAVAAGVPKQEVLELIGSAKEALEALPERPPAIDDVCPECGGAFAMVEDYLCERCRAIFESAKG